MMLHTNPRVSFGLPSTMSLLLMFTNFTWYIISYHYITEQTWQVSEQEAVMRQWTGTEGKEGERKICQIRFLGSLLIVKSKWHLMATRLNETLLLILSSILSPMLQKVSFTINRLLLKCNVSRNICYCYTGNPTFKNFTQY